MTEYYSSSPSLQPTRWAGGAYENSPNPELLPIPSWRRQPNVVTPPPNPALFVSPIAQDPTPVDPSVITASPDEFFDSFSSQPASRGGRGGKNGRNKYNTVNGVQQRPKKRKSQPTDME